MDKNPLLLLPARARQAVYILYGIAALGISATQVGYASIGIQNPPWLTVTLAVTGFLAVPVGTLAATNVAPDSTRPDEPEYHPDRVLESEGFGG